MKILFVADGRSPTALNWIRYFAEGDHEVHLVSTYECQPDLELASLNVLGPAISAGSAATGTGDALKRILPAAARTKLRQIFVPFTLTRAAERLAAMIDALQPDLVHAMRIPYEGMLAAQADPRMPLLVSVWGNDFTLHAPANARLRRLTRNTLQRADALHSDCQRDIQLAGLWGFPDARLRIVLPGAGGIQLDLFHPAEPAGDRDPVDRVINPRGLRAYVCNEAFFKAIPLVLEKKPATMFICPAMAGDPEPQRWVDQLDIAKHVDLLPVQPRSRMAALFQQAKVVVSPSTHDGTPNTLLEAMACGCFPVAGDLESLREWITPGVNGLLVDPRSPRQVADALLVSLTQENLLEQARAHNLRLVAEKADYRVVMPRAEQFYKRIVSGRSSAYSI